MTLHPGVLEQQQLKWWQRRVLLHTYVTSTWMGNIIINDWAWQKRTAPYLYGDAWRPKLLHFLGGGGGGGGDLSYCLSYCTSGGGGGGGGGGWWRYWNVQPWEPGDWTSFGSLDQSLWVLETEVRSYPSMLETHLDMVGWGLNGVPHSLPPGVRDQSTNIKFFLHCPKMLFESHHPNHWKSHVGLNISNIEWRF